MGMGVYFSWAFSNTVAAAAADCTLPTTPAFISKLGLYVLAYDNAAEANYNLSAKYEATVNRLVTATTNVPDSVVVILADLGADDDTHIIVATNGVATTLNCLPNSDRVLDTSILEYDVTDGQTLADFLVWGKTAFQPASATAFSYIGHGNPVTPYSEPPISEIVTVTAKTADSPHKTTTTVDALSPLPTRLDANPSFTDHHAPAAGELGLITPHALAVALAQATNNGADRFDVVDLLHCFAASIDELYEVAPYAGGLIGSPNYAFFDPTMPGVAFEQSLPEDIIAAYDNLHPATEHPHIIMSIEGDTVTDTVDAWANVSQELINEFDANAGLTANRLMDAYLNSVKYDTSVCDADVDWALEPPDALSDMKSFALELQAIYAGQNVTLTNALSDTVNSLEGSILTTVAQSGTPYFEEDNPDYWAFLGGESGVSLWTPFQPTQIDGTLYLPWQSLWYTDTRSYSLADNVEIGNPHPFRFITAAAQPTWANVLARFWQEQGIRPGVDVDTFFCTSELIPMKEETADLRTSLRASSTTIERGHKVTLTLALSNTHIATATQPILTFRPHTTTVSWLQLQTITPNQNCTTEAQVTRCQLPDMPTNTSQEVQVVYQTTAGYMSEPFQLLARVRASASTYEPNPVDNHQTTLINVLPTTSYQVYIPLILEPD